MRTASRQAISLHDVRNAPLGMVMQMLVTLPFESVLDGFGEDKQGKQMLINYALLNISATALRRLEKEEHPHYISCKVDKEQN